MTGLIETDANLENALRVILKLFAEGRLVYRERIERARGIGVATARLRDVTARAKAATP